MKQFTNSFIKFLPFFSFQQTFETLEIFGEDLNDNSALEILQESNFQIHNNSVATEPDNKFLTQVLFWLWDCARNGKAGSPCLAIVTNSLPTIHLMKEFKSRGYDLSPSRIAHPLSLPPPLSLSEFM